MAEDQPDLPIDRGWAWLVVLGYFISTFCMAGLGKSFGIFMEEFEGYFDTSVAMAALVMGVYGGVYTLAAPVCVAAGERYSQRCVVMVGGVIGGAGLCLGGLLLSIEWVIVIIGVLFGIGNASIFGNGLVMINQYFDKRRSLANGISLSGSSMGQFVIPPLLQFLLDKYLLQGTLVIVGGMYLHVSVCGALYRPVSTYKKKRRRDMLLTDPDNENNIKLSKTKNNIIATEKSTKVIKKHCDIEMNKISVLNDKEAELNNTTTTNNQEYVVAEVHVESTDIEDEKHVGDIDMENDTEKQSADQNHAEENEDHTNCYVEVKHVENETFITRQIDNGNINGSSKNNVNTLVHPKTDDSISSFDKKHTPPLVNIYRSFKTFATGLFDFSVVRNPVVILFVTISFLFFFGHFNFILFMPQTAYQRGLSKYQKAYLVSISGLFDLLGRISVGALGDLKLLQRYKLLALTTGLCGVIIFCFSFASSFLTMAILCGLYGFLGGGYVSINVPTLIDFVGLKIMPKVLGVVLFIQGIGAAIGQPLLGSIRDTTGSYKVVHIINGLAMVAGSLLLLLYPVVKKFNRRIL